MFFLACVSFLLVTMSSSQNPSLSHFTRDRVCDVRERVEKGCSREMAGARSLLECTILCGRHVSCIGTSLGGNRTCYHHYECQDIRFCIKEETNHQYFTRYCGRGAWTTTTDICTHCISACHARNCEEWRRRGIESDDQLLVDPDGPGETTYPPEFVFCHMTSFPIAKGVTVIEHDQQTKTLVDGYDAPQSYKSVLTYNMTFQQVISLVDQSGNCSQYISWECFHSHNHRSDTNLTFTGWLNRTRKLSDYFGGASPGSKSCACGMGASCATQVVLCNCDVNDYVSRKDEGYLTYKDDLPVYAFVAGDTGGKREHGYHVVGELRCWGIEQINSRPTP